MQEALENIVLLLSPIVPHICHTLWQALGHQEAILDVRWPTPDDAAMKQDNLEIVVQVNGKVRSRIAVARDIAEDAAVVAALADPTVARFVAGAPKKIIFVPGRLLNIVA